MRGIYIIVSSEVLLFFFCGAGKGFFSKFLEIFIEKLGCARQFIERKRDKVETASEKSIALGECKLFEIFGIWVHVPVTEEFQEEELEFIDKKCRHLRHRRKGCPR